VTGIRTEGRHLTLRRLLRSGGDLAIEDICFTDASSASKH
jgi:hypothetical protein